ncbi:MAG: phosphorylase family protein [Bdellovibrionota bacterium]
MIPQAAAGKIFASDTILAATAEQRAALRARTGAVSCDTESAIAADFARERGVPFIAVRAVADTSDINLPPAALLPLKADGTPDGSAIAWSLMSNPGQIPLLTTIAQDEKAALASLQKARAAMNLVNF